MDIISNAKESELRDSPSSLYVLETGFEEEPLSPTTSSDYEDDFEDDSHEEGVLTQSCHKYREKSLKLIDHLEDIDGDFVMYKDFNEIISDATKMNYPKVSSSSTDVHNYKCKHRGCHYKRKYCRIATTITYHTFMVNTSTVIFQLTMIIEV